MHPAMLTTKTVAISPHHQRRFHAAFTPGQVVLTPRTFAGGDGLLFGWRLASLHLSRRSQPAGRSELFLFNHRLRDARHALRVQLLALFFGLPWVALDELQVVTLGSCGGLYRVAL
jgi:hypothetical protein